mgnify:CR=1 FL=1
MVKNKKTSSLQWKKIISVLLPIFLLDILIKQVVQQNNIHTTNEILDITY